MFKFNKNSELKNLIEITKKKEKVKKEIIDWSWIAKILFISFIISFFSSFCCDVIGDICGIVSGAAGITIANQMSTLTGISLLICSLFVSAIIASLTIGGKAIGKSIAINNSDIILYEFSKAVTNFYKV